jgi:hypothetical protein
MAPETKVLDGYLGLLLSVPVSHINLEVSNRGMRKMEACLHVAPSDRTVLERLGASGKTPQKLAARARIVLLSGRGLGAMAVARERGVSKPTVWRWREAYLEGGIERLRKDKGNHGQHHFFSGR